MKTLTLFLSLAIISCTPSKETTDTPEKVMFAFKTKFPNASDVKWSKEGEAEFEAEFMMNGSAMSAAFVPDGNWLETETVIKAETLPDSVKSALAAGFADYTIEQAEWLESDKGSFYEIAIKSGEDKMEVQISPEGKLLNSKKKGKEEEGDDKN